MPSATTDTDLREMYRRWIDELWNGDPAVAGALLADDFVGHWPDREVHGPGDLATIVRETRAMFTDLTFTMTVGPVADGDLVAGRWTGRGQTADGVTRFFGNDILRVRDGRFVEYWQASGIPG